MHLIEQAFGRNCCLYGDVLQCPRDADAATLRKAYYRRALQYHPDKQPASSTTATSKSPVDPSGDGDVASATSPHLVFQAISATYQLLKNPESRAEYDETGRIPGDDEYDHDNQDLSQEGVQQWKNYFDQIFGKVTRSDIDAFAAKYKCSEEERRDVLKEFQQRRGDLVKMLDYVMLSEPRDALRWAEDYIRPAYERGEITKFSKTMESSLLSIQKKIEKERVNEQSGTDTETAPSDGDDEGDENGLDGSPAKDGGRRRSSGRNEANRDKKANQTKGRKPTKKAKSKDDFSDLVAQIQSKKRSRGNPWNELGSRYGVDMDSADPLNDEEFAKAQASIESKKTKKSKR